MNLEEPLGVAVFLRREKRIAFCQRLDPTRDFYLQWALVGGGVALQELHDPKRAAIRETVEETGVGLMPNELAYVGVSPLEGSSVACLYYVADLTRQQALRNVEPHKHSDWEFLTYEEAVKRPLIERIRPFLAEVYGR